ncbi:hypothetical protein ATANTOWER_020331 [Ataeniobius toweri]|uniref:Uncharacterized protein n=1 Tax=Ataeniobius toweri TaxID=208326 RepID=A0ABU7CAV1_9TELE|nr:hypothetical protein [Ataeniobius toweri]
MVSSDSIISIRMPVFFAGLVEEDLEEDFIFGHERLGSSFKTLWKTNLGDHLMELRKRPPGEQSSHQS